MRFDEKGWALLLAALLALGAQATQAVAQSAASQPAPTFVDSQVLFAVINGNGTFQRGNGVISVGQLGTGIYEISFNRNITTCAYKATIGLGSFAGESPAGEIGVTGRAGNVNGIYLTTYSGGIPTNRGFHLVVACP